jgi:hypothetical protein
LEGTTTAGDIHSASLLDAARYNRHLAVLIICAKTIVQKRVCEGIMRKEQLSSLVHQVARKVTAHPDVCLLCCRRVERPLVIDHELGPEGWIAMHSAELVGFLVFRLEVKDVDWQCHLIQAIVWCPVKKDLFDMTVIVVPQEGWDGMNGWKKTMPKFL